MNDLPEDITMEEYVSYKLLIGLATDEDLRSAPVDPERAPAFLTKMAKEELERRENEKMKACYYEDHSDADMGL